MAGTNGQRTLAEERAGVKSSLEEAIKRTGELQTECNALVRSLTESYVKLFQTERERDTLFGRYTALMDIQQATPEKEPLPEAEVPDAV